MLYKIDDSFSVVKSKEGDMIVVGPASWEVADMEYPTPDYPTIESQQKFLKKLFEMPEEYRNVSIDHQSLIIGKPLLKAIGDDGQSYFSHVHEKGMVLVTKIRGDTNLGWVQKYRDEIQRGVYKMYSIRASNTVREPAIIEGKRVNKVLDMDPIEVAIVKEGMCPKAGPLEVVAKSAEGSLVKTLEDLSKMTWEECIAEASANPKVDDPEALCGWLKAHGPNAKTAEPTVSSQPNMELKLEAERIFKKHFPDSK
jgi:hypothetical protein